MTSHSLALFLLSFTHSIKQFRLNDYIKITLYAPPKFHVHLRRISSHSWNHSQTIFSIEIWRQNHGCDYHLTDFFWKNMVASRFCHDRKSAFTVKLSIWKIKQNCILPLKEFNYNCRFPTDNWYFCLICNWVRQIKLNVSIKHRKCRAGTAPNCNRFGTTAARRMDWV